MSTTRFGIIPASLFDHGLGPAEVALIALLSTYADKNGWCWPSQSTLATKLGRSRAWVISSLKTLQEAKILEITRKSGGISKYRISYDACHPTNTSRQPADTEQYQEQEGSPPTPPKTRRAAIDPAWKPPTTLQTAMHDRYPEIDIATEAEKMVNWAIDQGKVGTDWNRRFQNWCATAEKMRKSYGRRSSPSRQSAADVLNRIRAATN